MLIIGEKEYGWSLSYCMILMFESIAEHSTKICSFTLFDFDSCKHFSLKAWELSFGTVTSALLFPED